MKVPVIGFCLAFCLLPGAAMAQTLTTGHMDGLDTNDDGVVDSRETAAFMRAAFDHLDANGDGSLASAETQGILTTAQFAETDNDGNGGISESEFLAQAAEDFGSADRDRDGQLE